MTIAVQPTPIKTWQHDHLYLGKDHDSNERRTWFVVALTAVMMVAEIIAGSIFGSMALLADGWHMSTHAAALAIAAVAYRLARKHANNPAFSFGTGKLGELAGYSSAVILAMIALFIAYESFMRLVSPVPIQFGEAIIVASIGLVVNLVSAWLLMGDHHHHHGHGHGHGHAHEEEEHDHDHAHHDHGHHGHDTNLRAAYIHVLTDALTSVLAIAALLGGRFFGWDWMDPAMGVIGSMVIAYWAYGLIRSAGSVLLDVVPSQKLIGKIRSRLEARGDRVSDLHVWRLGPGHMGVIASVVADQPQSPDSYKDLLRGMDSLSHVTIEVHPSGEPTTLPLEGVTMVKPEILSEIEHTAEHVPGIMKVMNISARWLGDKLHAEVDLGVDPSLPVSAADKITAAYEAELMEHIPALQMAHIRVRAA